MMAVMYYGNYNVMAGVDDIIKNFVDILSSETGIEVFKGSITQYHRSLVKGSEHSECHFHGIGSSAEIEDNEGRRVRNKGKAVIIDCPGVFILWSGNLWSATSRYF